jgi:hypothetical protein
MKATEWVCSISHPSVERGSVLENNLKFSEYTGKIAGTRKYAPLSKSLNTPKRTPRSQRSWLGTLSNFECVS